MLKKKTVHFMERASTSCIKKYKVILLLLVSFFLTCASGTTGPGKDVVERKFKTSGRSILNYEDAAKKFTIDVKRSHFLIHIEIEKPCIIKSARYDVNKIYRVSGIEGTAVYRVSLSSNGKILSYEQVKRAGLGLDAIAEDILKTMKVSPGVKSARSGKTDLFVRIVFAGRDRL